jgi:hypothetical protein
MATIRREVTVDADAAQVWDAFKDVGALHTRVVRGFVTATELDGADRLVTFANGFSVRERIVTIDDDARRLVYTAVGGRTTHYNAAVEVLAEPAGRVRIVWLVDLLPDDVAPVVAGMMDHGVAAMATTLGAATGSRRSR